MPRCLPGGELVMEIVITKLDGNIGTIIMNHSNRHNAIGEHLAEGIIDALDAMEDAGAQVVVLRAQPGVRIWSAGHDINELPRGRRDPLGYADALEKLLRRVQDF